MVKIRLQKLGKTHQPTFRIVAADPRVKQTGRVKEVLGTYNPRAKGKEREVTLEKDRLEYWLGCGAQPTETMLSILKKNGLLPERLAGKPGVK